MKTILLKIDNQGLAYNTAGRISWAQTNLPKEAFSVREAEPVFWEAAMVSYDASEAKLTLRVLDFSAEMDPRFAGQQPKKPIRQLVFEPLDDEPFKAQLSYYNAKTLAPFLKGTETETASINTKPWTAPPAVFADTPDWVREQYPPKVMANGVIEQEYEVDLMSTEFQLGQVKVNLWVEEINADLALLLYNDTILPEFDHIKSFFIQALKKPTIRIQARIEIAEGKLIAQEAHSADIARINDDLIGVVRSLRVAQLTKAPVVIPIDKDVFTDEELFAAFAEEDPDLGNAYREEADQAIITELLELGEVRNRKQLLYLAGKLHNRETKIRFTLSPLFGFIFTLKGEQMNHFVWELLHSHATYVWSIPKTQGTIDEQYAKVERIIGLIRAQGRQHYRQHYHQVHDFDFHLVTHQFAGSAVKDDFPRWKHRLLEHLI